MVMLNKKAIIYPYKNQMDQIAITGLIRRKINLEINSTDESINKKELIKYAIRQAMELGKRDIIVQLKRMYLVKIFETNKITKETQAKPKARQGEENRYNGYTEEEIEDSYDTIFQTTDIDSFLKPVMKIVFSQKLNFSEITNQFYEKNALKIIQQAIANELLSYLSLEEDFIVGLSGYIFRKYFYKVHELIAIELLEQIYLKNQNAEKFLSYYTGNVIVENTRKYIIPSLETKDGKQWSNSAILALSSLWMNTRSKIKTHKQKLLGIDEQISEAEDNYEITMIKIEELNKAILVAHDQIEDLKEAFKEKSNLLSSYAKKGMNFSAEENQTKNDMKMDEQKIKELRDLISKNKKQINTYEKSNSELNIYKDNHRKSKMISKHLMPI